MGFFSVIPLVTRQLFNATDTGYQATVNDDEIYM